MAKLPPAQFVGPLAEPVRVREETLLETPLDVFREEVRCHLYDKLPLLAIHYGAPKNKEGQIDWREVCLRLAIEADVPGFQIKAKLRARGRPKINAEDDWKLLHDVAEARFTNSRMSVLAACRALVKNKKGRWFGQTPNTLEVRYSEQKRRFNGKFGYEYNSAEHRQAYATRQGDRQSLID